MLGTTFRVTNSEVNVIVVRIIILKRLPIVNLFTIMIRKTTTLTFELVTLNVVPNIYILGKSKYSIASTLVILVSIMVSVFVTHKNNLSEEINK